MNTKFIKLLLSSLLISIITITNVEAASVSVKCTKTSNRSKISVDGKGVSNGKYRAIVRSGRNLKGSPFQVARLREVEFDFDSNRKDILEGATAIPRGFIVKNRVSALLKNARGAVVASANNIICKSK